MKTPNDLIRTYAKTFSTAAGQEVLEELRSRIGRRLSYVKGDPYETALREGERRLFLTIETFVEAGKNPERAKALLQERALDEEPEEA